jgi:hypothetical protein
MRSENSFSTFICGELKRLLEGQGLSVGEGVNILTDVTCIFESGTFELLHGFAQTDVAIYKEAHYNISNTSSGLTRFYGDKEIHNGRFLIPYVILELKAGELTTDAIRCRDFVARRIRDIFPFSAYYFIAENTQKEEKTLLRQGKSFTNYFISREQMGSSDFLRIFENYIQPHINNLNRQLHKL